MVVVWVSASLPYETTRLTCAPALLTTTLAAVTAPGLPSTPTLPPAVSPVGTTLKKIDGCVLGATGNSSKSGPHTASKAPRDPPYATVCTPSDRRVAVIPGGAGWTMPLISTRNGGKDETVVGRSLRLSAKPAGPRRTSAEATWEKRWAAGRAWTWAGSRRRRCGGSSRFRARAASRSRRRGSRTRRGRRGRMETGGMAWREAMEGCER